VVQKISLDLHQLKNKKMDFFQLIKEGDLEKIKAVVAQDPALVHQKNERGFPPLVMASYSNHLDLTHFFLESGADINALDAVGNTALMGLCFKGYLEIVKLLLEKNADVNVRNIHGSTALIYAATFGHTEVVSALLAAGADKSFKDAKGNDAYTYAKSKGIVELTELLA